MEEYNYLEIYVDEILDTINNELEYYKTQLENKEYEITKEELLKMVLSKIG